MPWPQAKRDHHAAYMREWRKSHPMTDDQRRKDRIRSRAGNAKRRGVIVPEPCQNCGGAADEMHHVDYSKPLAVVWYCRPCHVDLHRFP